MSFYLKLFNIMPTCVLYWQQLIRRRLRLTWISGHSELHKFWPTKRGKMVAWRWMLFAIKCEDKQAVQSWAWDRSTLEIRTLNESRILLANHIILNL